MRQNTLRLMVACCGLAGCAGYEFHETPRQDALTYWETTPFLVVATEADCKQSFSILAIPTHRRSVSLKSGYGSTDLNIDLKDGMVISHIGQKTENKIPDTLNALPGLATGYATLLSTTRDKSAVTVPRAEACQVGSTLYAIDASSGTPTFKPVRQFAP